MNIVKKRKKQKYGLGGLLGAMSPGMLLFFWHIITRVGGKVPRKVREKHYTQNGKRHFAPGRFIENQAELSGIPFGSHKKSNMAYSGCEIIATFNYLVKRDRKKELPDLIRSYEEKGASLRGGFGVEPKAIYRFLKKEFPDISYFSAREARAVLPLVENGIVTIQNDRKNLFAMIHTVCITKEEDGYVIHNAYRRNIRGRWMASEPFPTFEKALERITTRPKLLCLIAEV